MIYYLSIYHGYIWYTKEVTYNNRNKKYGTFYFDRLEKIEKVDNEYFVIKRENEYLYSKYILESRKFMHPDLFVFAETINGIDYYKKKWIC